VLAMKDAGVDGANFLMQQNSAFSIITGLRQQGAALKVPLLAGGYGADLLASGPEALRDAQGAYFSLSYEPVEMHTAATEAFQAALKQYGGVTEVPSLNNYLAYVSIDAFVTGLQKAGPDPTQASLINAMLNVTSYDAAGLFGDHTMGFSMAQRAAGGGAGAGNCLWFLKFEGSAFQLVPGADPICGTVIPGKTVS
jgi:branched-chain amino acid transport system substrate-binding protein